MKIKFLILILVICLPFFGVAKTIELTYEFENGEQLVRQYDDSAKDLVLYISDSKNSMPLKKIKNIKGFENWENLENFDSYGIDYSGDLLFLNNIKNLKSIFFDFFKCKKLSFLENLTGLEFIEIHLSLDKKDYKDFENTKIDFSKLKKLRKITFSAYYFDNGKFVGKLNRIPWFVNVQNKPELIFYENDINELTARDKKLLKQYSKYDLGEKLKL